MTFDLTVPNLGFLDRAARGLAGASLMAWALLGGPLWAAIGIVPLATALTQFCPLYALLGISTVRERRQVRS